MKIILNKCFGGFGISHEGYKLYAKKKGLNLFAYKTSNDNFKYLEKINDDSIGVLTYYFTKDLGLKIHRDDIEEWESHLYLSGEYRTDPILIEVVEELKEKANGSCSELTIVEIPDDMEYEITEYDGIETLREKHRSW